jgi:molecular chaperone DnaJ
LEAVAKRDYYEILMVSRDIDQAGLKTAYRKVALKYHPDRNPDDPEAEEIFKEISEAYSVLSDSQKRQAYDRFGHSMGGAGGGFQSQDFGSFGDLFGDLFGEAFGFSGGRGGRQRGRGQRGADLRYNLEITLDDVLAGLEKSLEIPKMRSCTDCDGSGINEGSERESCRQCGGAGQVLFQQGLFRIQRPCDACNGAGEIIRDPCRSCRGTGRSEGSQTISVKIPPGVGDGARLRLSNEGEAGIAGGPPGDLYVVLNVKAHSILEREEQNLHCEVPITFVQAALGAEIEVPTLEGKETLRVPEGTQTGGTFRLRGKGLPSLRSSVRGDQFVRIFVEVPTKLSGRQREILEEFAEETDSEVSKGSHPTIHGFMEKLRNLFD